jgi:hypothetical protein
MLIDRREHRQTSELFDCPELTITRIAVGVRSATTARNQWCLSLKVI